jgi:hypothetical protein
MCYKFFPQIISPQSSASDRRLPLARVLCPSINTCLPHAPPAGHWSSLALVLVARANGFFGAPMAWSSRLSGADERTWSRPGAARPRTAITPAAARSILRPSRLPMTVAADEFTSRSRADPSRTVRQIPRTSFLRNQINAKPRCHSSVRRRAGRGAGRPAI